MLHAVLDATRSMRARRLVRRIALHHATHFGDRASLPSVRRLLFVCHGNICRSPFAERLAKVQLEGCSVSSAGVRAKPNLRSPDRLVQIAQAMGLDLESRRSVRLGAAHVTWADLILVMDGDNFSRVAADFPEAVTKMTLLGLFARGASAVIRDPDPGSEDAILDVLDQIREAVNGLVAWLRADEETSAAAICRRPGLTWSVTAAVEAAVAGRLPETGARVRNGERVPTHPIPRVERDEPCAG
jgi:protein-tyrosine-phosphatase